MVTEVTEGAYIDKARRLTAPGAVTYISANELLAVIAGLLAQLDARGASGAAPSQPEGAGAACHDCGRPYGDEHGFPDLVVDNETWRRISPSGDEGGLLCPSCLCKRAHDAGIEHAAATFRSGPFCRHEPEGMETTTEERSRFGGPGSTFLRRVVRDFYRIVSLNDRLSAEIASLKAKLAEAEVKKAETVKAEREAWLDLLDALHSEGKITEAGLAAIRAHGGSDEG